MKPLRHRDFAAVLAAGLGSDTGDWLLRIALPLYVFAATSSALSTSTLFLAELLPALVLGSFAGVLVDRWDPRRTMVAASLAQALCLLPLLAASRDRLWLLYVVAAAEALLTSVFDPAKQRLLIALLPPAKRGSGNALIGTTANLSRLVGSPLGGLLFAAVGLRDVVVIDAATYLLSAGIVAAVRGARPDRDAPTTERAFLREWAAGLAVVRRSRRVATLFAVTVLGQAAQGMFLVLFVLFVLRTLHGGDAEVGLLRGMQAIGAVLGGLVVAALIRRVDGRRLLGWGFVVFGAVSLAMWNAPRLTTATTLYAGLFAVVGAPAVAADTALVTELQLLVPEALLGRVYAALATSGLGAQAVGLLVAGVAADRVGVVGLLDVQALTYVGCGVLALVALKAGSGTRQIITSCHDTPVIPGEMSRSAGSV